jgi:hypothetical protein
MAATQAGRSDETPAGREDYLLPSGIGIYLLAVLLELVLVVLRTHGQQIYAVDDAYIHASIARNLVQHHIYGTTPFATVFASSSILWPYLIAAVFLVTGVQAWVPFALNVLFGVASLIAAKRLLDALTPAMSLRLRAGALFTFAFGAPLVGMAFSGMEHLLQLASVLFLLEAYLRLLNEPRSVNSPVDARTLALAGLALLAASVRYEALLLLFPMCVALLFHRRIAASALVAVCGFTPAVLFGLYVQSRTGAYLSNSITVKSAGHIGFLALAKSNFLSRPSLAGSVTICFLLAVIVLVLALVYSDRQKRPSRSLELLAILLITFTLHAGLGKFGWFFRYEVYLLGSLTVVVFAVCVSAWKLTVFRVLLALFVVGMFVRGALITWVVPGDAQGIYEQQFQMGRFLAHYYSGHTVALNDVGAATFLSDIHCVDLWGLSSPEVARLITSGTWDRPHVTALSGKVEVAILLPSIFGRLAPSNWIPVATLTATNLPAHTTLASNQIEFYAAEPVAAAALRANLADFKSQLPPGLDLEFLAAP